jgi:hypothetical protein
VVPPRLLMRQLSTRLWSRSNRRLRQGASLWHLRLVVNGGRESFRLCRERSVICDLPGWVKAERRDQVKTAIVESARLRPDSRQAADELRALVLGNLGGL